MPNPEQPIPAPLNSLHNFELKYLDFCQNIEILVGNFGGIHVRIMHAKFQASSSTGVGEE